MSFVEQESSSFRPSGVVGRKITDYRKSLQLQPTRPPKHITDLVVPYVRNLSPDLAREWGLKAIENPQNIEKIESTIIATPNGGYFKCHQDRGTPHNVNIWYRMITYILYFHQQDYEGGEIVFYPTKVLKDPFRFAKVSNEPVLSIKPNHNSLLLFPSHIFHEVRPVKADSDDIMFSRFTLNGWVHRKSTIDIGN